MNELKTKVRKAQYWLRHNLFVFDNIVIIIAGVFCLIWTWGSVSSMTRNWSLAQALMNRQREKARLELEVETLELENEYYLSEEYQELVARKYQGKTLPGESMVYLPDNTDAAKNKHIATPDDETSSVASEMSNFQQWIAFLFGV